MKKIICISLSLILITSFFGCSRNKKDETNLNTSESNTQSFDTETPSVTEITEPIINSTVADDNTTESRKINDNATMVIFGETTGNTVTGLKALPSVSYSVSDPDNARGLSTKKICHSHGPASGGKAHFTVVEFQKTFDKYGALTLDNKSNEKCLYLTFDCGYEYNNLTSVILDTLKEKDVKATFFCTLDHIKKETDLIKRMIAEGHIVGNHSATHPSFAEIPRKQMAKEIEDTENYLRKNFGYCAKYFRFPAGEYNENALDLVSSLGYMSVFWSVAYNDWNVKSTKGKDYAVKTVMDRLHNGAVILLHSVSKDNAEALGEIIDKARAEGYVFKSLTDYKA